MRVPFKHNRILIESQVVPLDRFWEAEIPVGDPFGGPAYGEKNKKLVKAAVMVTAVVATGGAFLAAPGLLTGLAFAGSSLSLIGAATGNEKLSKIGAIAGLAGAVGAIGSNVINASGATFGEQFQNGLADTVKQIKEGTKGVFDNLKGSTLPEPSALSGGLDGVAGDAGGALSGLTGAQGVATLPVQQNAFNLNAPDLSQQPALVASNANLPGSAAPVAPSVNPVGLDGVAGDAGGVLSGLQQSAGSAASGSGGLIAKAQEAASGALKFAKDTPAALLLGGQALAGAMSTKEERRQLELKRQQELEDRARFNASIQYAPPVATPGEAGAPAPDLFANRVPTYTRYMQPAPGGLIRNNLRSA